VSPRALLTGRTLGGAPRWVPPQNSYMGGEMGKLFKRFMEWKALKAIFNMGRRRGHGDPPRRW